MGWIVPFIPYIAQGAGAVAGYFSSRGKKKKAEAERARALSGAQGVSDLLTSSGTGLTNMGMRPLEKSLGYYATLLGGNRSQMALATAGPRAAITDQYRGAAQGLEHSGIRGAQRDVAQADLNRDRASRIAGLTTGVQPQAAGALAQIGSELTGQGGNRLGSAGRLWGDLLGGATDDRNRYEDDQASAGAQLGRIAFDAVGTYYGTRGAGGGYAGLGTAGYPGDAVSNVNNPIPPTSALASNPSSSQMYYDMLSGQQRRQNPYVLY